MLDNDFNVILFIMVPYKYVNLQLCYFINCYVILRLSKDNIMLLY